ncbi:DNA-binding protein [Pusillimonas sp. T2]|uniref:hypothetical protein n=1 Tax=Pusillimonas sp. T2 TaxID=1548123 RepID=UPI000B9C93EF|nr:hypothetical protein [Pusillimonas sp. T2]OXR49468.1 DNA-binding protein [Pusillimonas sp. T2]
MEYIFTLKYQLADSDCDQDDLVERFGQAGCDDALVGMGLPGRLALEFTREAEDADSAVRGALADVQRVVPSATLIEVAPDWVGLTDVAQIVGGYALPQHVVDVAHAALRVNVPKEHQRLPSAPSK